MDWTFLFWDLESLSLGRPSSPQITSNNKLRECLIQVQFGEPSGFFALVKRQAEMKVYIQKHA